MNEFIYLVNTWDYWATCCSFVTRRKIDLWQPYTLDILYCVTIYHYNNTSGETHKKTLKGYIMCKPFT